MQLQLNKFRTRVTERFLWHVVIVNGKSASVADQESKPSFPSWSCPLLLDGWTPGPAMPCIFFPWGVVQPTGWDGKQTVAVLWDAIGLGPIAEGCHSAELGRLGCKLVNLADHTIWVDSARTIFSSDFFEFWFEWVGLFWCQVERVGAEVNAETERAAALREAAWMAAEEVLQRREAAREAAREAGSTVFHPEPILGTRCGNTSSNMARETCLVTGLVRLCKTCIDLWQRAKQQNERRKLRSRGGSILANSCWVSEFPFLRKELQVEAEEAEVAEVPVESVEVSVEPSAPSAPAPASPLGTSPLAALPSAARHKLRPKDPTVNRETHKTHKTSNWIKLNESDTKSRSKSI